MRFGLRRPAPWVSACAAGALLYLARAAAEPVGRVQDDALHILLARSLAHGAFALPDAAGAPVTDPLPGFPLLLAVPAALVEPHWGLLKVFGLLSAAALAALTWKLAKRVLPPSAAACAAGLTALNPVLLSYSGVITPDIPYAALSLGLLELAARPASTGRLVLLAAGAAFACLLRPYGALLAACLGLALLLRDGAKKAAAFTAAALAPLALWTWRNHVVAGTVTAYAVNWRSQVASLGEPGAQGAHVGRFLELGGRELLGLPGLSAASAIAAGAAALLLAALGALRSVKRSEEPWLFAAAAYASLVMALHATWTGFDPRYLLPLLPLLWIFIIEGAAPLLRSRAGAAVGAAAVLGTLALSADLGLTTRALEGSFALQPETMAWIRAQTTPAARFQTVRPASLRLLTGRPASPPSLQASSRDAWLAAALHEGVEYVHAEAVYAVGGFVPAGLEAVAPNLARWARSSLYVSQSFASPSEGTIIFKLAHPDPRAYLRAWSELQAAGEELARGRRDEARERLEKAVKLEPELASAWAALSGFETKRGRKLADLEKAAMADPSSAEIAADLAELRRSPRK